MGLGRVWGVWVGWLGGGGGASEGFDFGYNSLKAVLGAERSSLGAGAQHRLLLTLGVRLRLGTKLAIRIGTARARLLSLPVDSPVTAATQGALSVTGRHWLTDALLVLASIGLDQTLGADCFLPVPGSDPQAARRAVLRWKREVLLPAAYRYERNWFQSQISAHDAWPWTLPHWDNKNALDFLSNQCWGKAMWRHARAWLLARASNLPPFAALGRADLMGTAACPLCGSHCSLEHVLTCALVIEMVGPPPTSWPTILEAASDDAPARIKWVGRAMAALVASV